MADEALAHIIDDDDAVRESLSFLFEMAGVAACAYATPQAFLAVAAGLTKGCIVTDIRMPQMSGLEMARRVRQLGVTLPIIVITGHGDALLAEEAVGAGALRFFEKPFPDEALLDAVKSAMGLS